MQPVGGGCCCENDVRNVTQSSPSTSVSFIHTLPDGPAVARITGSENPELSSLTYDSESCESLKDVHIVYSQSARLMEEFLDLASDNTSRNIETCGVLGAFLEERIFYVTNLIIPKQESTSNSCQAMNEEEIFSIQNQMSLFPIGWIHTHPSQSCFMSSIDLHTQYSYQIMLPEAVGIVMAPTDNSRKNGIFRLTDPVGMSIIKDCKEKEFHLHTEPDDSSPIYVDCSNVYINPNLRLEIYDLR